MKYLYVTIFVSFIFSSSYGQITGGNEKNYEIGEIANNQTRKMKEILKLNDVQESLINDINFYHGLELNTACSNPEKGNMQKKFAYLNSSRNEALKRVLNDEQYKTFKSLQNRQKELTLEPFKLASYTLDMEGAGKVEFKKVCIKSSSDEEANLKQDYQPIPWQTRGRNLINSDGSAMDDSYGNTIEKPEIKNLDQERAKDGEDENLGVKTVGNTEGPEPVFRVLDR